MKTLLRQFVVLTCWACLPAFAQSKPAADLIITNAKIWTVDKSRPTAQAVAVLEGRIVVVGSNADTEAWRGPMTQVIDAGGKLLLPGFNDAHVHFVSGGSQLDNVQLNDATSAQEFARRIGEHAKTLGKDEWMLGGDWDETKWQPAQMPTKDLIDPITPNNPVFVARYDGHMGLANSLALKLAGNRALLKAVRPVQVLKNVRSMRARSPRRSGSRPTPYTGTSGAADRARRAFASEVWARGSRPRPRRPRPWEVLSAGPSHVLPTHGAARFPAACPWRPFSSAATRNRILRPDGGSKPQWRAAIWRWRT